MWKILTISDVHIRSLERHQEYKQVFKKLLDEAEQLRPDFIFNLGDLFHNKLQLSPEAVILTRWFYKKLTKIAPVYTIIGNHDMNVTNNLRPDSITATISDIQNHYILKHSSFQEIVKPLNDKKGIAIGHFSFFESQSEWPKNIPNEFKDHINIALYHGAVDKYETDSGFFENSPIKYSEWFTEYDAVICGDIHKFQKITDNCYMVGNLIQQNFGENIDKGYLLWTFNDKNKIRIDRKLILNDFNYINVFLPFSDLDKAKELINKELKQVYVTKNSNIKLMISTTRVVDVALKEDLSKFVIENYGITPIIEESFRLNTTPIDGNKENDVKPKDFSDFSYQNELIINYLNNEFNLPKDITVDEICDINKEINNDIGLVPNYGTKTWNILDFTFSNMFQYGEDISINFKDLKGVVGLFGENAAGKSNLLNALSFTIFGQTITDVSNIEIIRDGQPEALGVINIERGGKYYKITRKLVRQKDKAKHTLEFSWRNGNDWDSLNDETVIKTNQVIAEHLGTFENFCLTTLSTQDDFAKFIKTGNTSRKDIVMSNLGIGIFSNLYDYSKDKLKEINAVVKNYEDSDKLMTNLSMYKTKSVELQSQVNQEQTKLVKLKDIVKKIEEKIRAEESKISPISCLIIDEDKSKQKIEYINSEIDKLKLIKEQNDNDLQETKMSITKTKQQIDEFQTKISSQLKVIYSDIGKLEESIKRHKNITSKFGEINCEQNDCVLLQLYKKDCCDIEQVNKDLEKLKNGEKTLIQKQSDLKETIKLHDKTDQLYKKTLEIETRLEKFNFEIENENRLVKEFNDNKTIIKKNNEIQETINKLKISRSTGSDAIANSTAFINANNKLIKEYEVIITEIIRKIDYVHEMKRKANVLVVYNNIMNPNALPNNVLKKYINILETEVNKILNMTTGLKTRFYLDTREGKKTSELIIEFKNQNNDEWHSIASSSGAEKMLLSLAIRVALILITTLYKSNLLIIDEGFSSISSNRLPDIKNVFHILRTMFSSIIIISHLDTIKDIPDEIIQVINEDKKSSLVV